MDQICRPALCSRKRIIKINKGVGSADRIGIRTAQVRLSTVQTPLRVRGSTVVYLQKNYVGTMLLMDNTLLSVAS